MRISLATFLGSTSYPWVMLGGYFKSFFMPSDLLFQTLSLYDVIQQYLEGLIEVLTILGTRLVVRNVVIRCECSGHILINLDIVDKVALVSKHDYL